MTTVEGREICIPASEKRSQRQRKIGAHMTQTDIKNRISLQRQAGVSLLELMITLAIGMILMAMAAPLVSTTISISRLRGAGGDYANLLQTARMRAVVDDKYYNVVNTVGPRTPASPVNSFVNTGVYTGPLATGGPVPANTYVIGDPAVDFNTTIYIRPPAAAPNVANLTNQFLPPPNINVVINPNAWGPTYGSRGLPCAPNLPTGGQCFYTVGAPPQPVAFEVFLQNQQTGMWEAVTVNPSGRVRLWNFNQGQGVWQPLN
jgi:Tfp pilus assembly protein FimT